MLRKRGKIAVCGRGELPRRLAGQFGEGYAVDEVDEAGVEKIGFLLLVDGCVERLAEGLAKTIELCRERRSQRLPPLHCIVMSLAAEAPEAGGLLQGIEVPDSIRLRVLSLPTLTARWLMRRYPPYVGADIRGGQHPHLLIAGFGPMGLAIALRAVRLAHYGIEPPVITVLDKAAQACKKRFFDSYPRAGNCCKIGFQELRRPRLTSRDPVTAIYVCMPDDESSADMAQRLKAVMQSSAGSPPLYLCLDQHQPISGLTVWDGQTFPFSSLECAGSLERLLEDPGDALARVVHDYYRDSIRSQGREPEENPAGMPWPILDESYREASRQQADHIGAKLAIIGCRPVVEEMSDYFAFAPMEAERLARLEHDRWCADRYLDGWSYGDERDNARKHHPTLVPYDELSRHMKDLDRYAVRLAPMLFAKMGSSVARNLEVGLYTQEPGRPVSRKLNKRIDAILERLRERFPGRFPVFYSTLEGAAERLMIRRAMEGAGAALHLLLEAPFETLLQRLDEESRSECLELIACAEQRIYLPGKERLNAFLACRPEVLVLLWDGPSEIDTQAGVIWRERVEGGAGKPASRIHPRSRKTVWLHPEHGESQWNFDY